MGKLQTLLLISVLLCIGFILSAGTTKTEIPQPAKVLCVVKSLKKSQDFILEQYKQGWVLIDTSPINEHGTQTDGILITMEYYGN